MISLVYQMDTSDNTNESKKKYAPVYMFKTFNIVDV